MNRYLEDFVGNTPLVRLKRMNAGEGNVVLAKLEGNNPAGSVKDRPALSMIRRAQDLQMPAARALWIDVLITRPSLND